MSFNIKDYELHGTCNTKDYELHVHQYLWSSLDRTKRKENVLFIELGAHRNSIKIYVKFWLYGYMRRIGEILILFGILEMKVGNVLSHQRHIEEAAISHFQNHFMGIFLHVLQLQNKKIGIYLHK